MVETALILPVLILLLLLGIDLGRVFFASIDLRNAAHEATMFGGTDPETLCDDPALDDLKAVVDRQMGRSAPADAVCGPLTSETDRAFITEFDCERADAGPPCNPWAPPYPADADLRYVVRLEYRFQPMLPLVGALTGNGFGGSVPIVVENRSPVLIGYEGQ